jgi:DNA (cytosine-5)-methyltransferase 1
VRTAVSLFAGVGGFDLALERNGVKVVASVEIDKKAQEVLKKHFPQSTIFGDITGVTGEQLIAAGFEPRNGIITGGFPCQDLSVAGKRAGLGGSRSGLFWEICRLLDETRAQNFILENVPGLLNSNNGADMAVVLEALVERGYRVAYRVLDAQHFGVPQRRRRVFIVGCLGDTGRSPEEILAIAEGRAGYLAQGGKTRKSVTKSITKSVGAMLSNGGEIANCLPAELYHKSTVVNQDVNSGHLVLFAPHREDGARIQNDTVNTLTATMGTGGNNVPMLAYPMHGAMIGRNDSAGPSGSGFLGANEPGYTLTSSSQARHGVVIVPMIFSHTQGLDVQASETNSPTLRTGGAGMAVVYPIDDARELEKHQNGTGIGTEGAPAYTLDRQQAPAIVAFSPSDFANYSEGVGTLKAGMTNNNSPILAFDAYNHTISETNQTLRTGSDLDKMGTVFASSVVRRLTPVECERLQGFPDNWTDGQTDGHRYKQMGNAVAVPVVQWIILRMVGEND